ncbi:MAG: DUF2505 family protein [Acidimicrobiia bacterium]
MRFRLDQTFAAALDAVALAFTEADLYQALGTLPRLGQPEVLNRREDGDVVSLEVRYRFTGDLSPAARKVIDPDRLTWVEHSTHDLGRHQVDFRLLPDNYANLLSASGHYSFSAAGPELTRRVTEGDVAVRVPLVGKSVETAIVSGLQEHLAREVPVVERYLAG